ncbi:hypothetical protein CRUP_032911, partial [Coryphaenoides rupestris]
EIAKRIQEEEELRGRGPERLSDGSTLPPAQPRDGCLDLGTLRQVLQDEELARRLQEQEEEEEEERQRTSRTLSCHEGDFRVAQVAQDESPQLQGQGERQDSDDLPSPTDEQPPSPPASTMMKTPQIRNIAEELDPTFRARPLGEDSLRSGQTGPSCQSLPAPPAPASRDAPEKEREPGFVPPTKRPSDKSARKPKEKKENCKQQ